jgi:Ca-activated chloride channel homolog
MPPLAPQVSCSNTRVPELTQPAYLLLLLPVPLLAWWWLRRQRGALRFPDTAGLALLPHGRVSVAQWAGAGLRALALALLLLALAGPRWPDLRTRLPAEGIAIEMVVDISGSTAERDFLWEGEPVRRLDAVKRVFRLFVSGGEGPDGVRLEGRPNDQIGLVVFGTRPDSACPLTLSHAALLTLLEAEQPRSLPTESQTNIGDALAWGLHRLESAGPRRKVLVLLTDGEHNVPPPALTPRQAAHLAAGLGVPIYVIDAGGEEPEAPAKRIDSEKALRAVAQITGGRYFPARDTTGLLEVCRAIDRLERRATESFQYRRYYEAYLWFGLGALGCLVAVRLLELSVWRRLP